MDALKRQAEKESREATELFIQRTHEEMKKSAVEREFSGAALLAKQWSEMNGFFPTFDDDGNPLYTVSQGIKAACHGREDVAAILIIQKSILARLEKIKTLLLIGIAILVYIAVRVS